MIADLLKGKRGVIFGAVDEQSIAWHVALSCAESGATFVLTNTRVALQLGSLKQLSADRDWSVVECDATNVDEIKYLFEQAQEILGGKIDFVLHSVAQSMNLRRHVGYEEANYNYFLKTIDISALSFHKVVRGALDIDALSQGASVVTLTYLASERYCVGYNDMGDAKAMLESMVRQLGAVCGERIGARVNAISQSVTPTRAASNWEDMDLFYKYADEMSPLGNASASDCADLCVALFSDLTRKVTMQTIYNDGGFSHTMLTRPFMDDYRKTL